MLDLMTEESIDVQEIAYFDKIYYLFDRHRISFLCWLKAFKEELIQKDNLLITLDNHCDLFVEDADKTHMELAKSMNISKVRDNIKDNNRQDFIIMGMETGIIGDAVIISPIINMHEFPKGIPSEYKDSHGNTHKAFYYKNVEEFENDFILKDKNVILDIDFDYFQTHIIDSSLPSEKWKYSKRLTKEERKAIFKPKSKLNEIYHKSRIITLAKEMKYSQGKGEKWAEEFIGLFFSLEEMKRGGLNPFEKEEDYDF